MATKAQKAEQAEAFEDLRSTLSPGDVVYCVLRHVSRSGMKRVIDLYVIREGDLCRISWSVSRALGWKLDGSHDGIVVNGCGMDMGFHLVYSLGQALWPNGTPKPHGARNGEPDSTGGYAIKARWV